jgi:TonB family protein
MAPVASPPLLEKPAQGRTPRRCARQRVTTLMYADLGPGNGGFPINLSEDGMAFQGIRPLVKDQQLHVTLKLDGINQKVSAAARVVWLTENGKGGGLQFVDLTDASRQLIRDWIALQLQAGGPKETRPPVIPPIKAKAAQSRPVGPAPTAHPSTLPQAKPAIITAPRNQNARAARPAPPVPTRTKEPAITSASPRQEKPVVETAISPRPSEGLLGLRPARQIRPSSAKDGDARPKISFKHVGLALVIAGAGLLVFAALRHPLHGVGLAQFFGHRSVREASRTAQRPSAPRVSQPTAPAEPSRDLAMVEPLPLAPIASAREKLVTPLPPRATPSTASRGTEKPVKPALQSAPAPAAKPAIASTIRIQRPTPPTPPTHLEQPMAAPPAISNPVTPANFLRGAAAAPELPAAPLAEPSGKAPENASKLAGTVEIIPDLYPTIRMPAGSKGQAPRPGTSLRIGRLYSKIEPAYPQEALRQHIAGTVKVHLLIGTNGTVDRAELVDGPAALAEPVLRDVRQWLYEPTLVGTQAIEVEQDISFKFRIANSSTAAN